MPYSEQTWNDGEAGGTPVSAARLTHMETGIGDALEAASNLSDIPDDSTARTNLGLGDSATLDVGTGSGDVAAGNHNHTGTYANASHTHAGSDVNTGTVPIAQIPTGTSGTTVSLGNHTHAETSSNLTMGTNIQGWPSSGTAPVAYKDTLGWVRLDGGIESTGTITAGNTLATLPASYRPAGARQFTMRHTVTSASTGTISVTTGGVITYNSGFNSGAIMDFTGVQFRAA